MTLQDSTHLMTIRCREKKHLQQISVQIPSQPPLFFHQNCQNGRPTVRPSPGGCHGWLPPGRRGSPRVRRSASTSGPGGTDEKLSREISV